MTISTVEVHGGLTYANACSGHICHVPKQGEPDDVWWFGFDTSHAGDFSPELDLIIRKCGGRRDVEPYDHDRAIALHAVDWSAADVYRTLDYVQQETNRLADQLAVRAKDKP